MNFTIKNNKIEVNKNKSRYVIPISENTERELKEKLVGNKTLKNKLTFSLVMLLPFSILLFIINYKVGTIYSLVLALLVLVIIGVIILINYWKEKIIIDFISTIEGDEEYILAKEIVKTEKQISQEQNKLSDLMNAKYSSLNMISKNDKLLHQEELQQLNDTLKHLELRMKLRKVKIDFFQKYLRKVQLIQAINIAEDAILLDYQSTEEEKNTALINPEKIKEEILYLKPLSEKMNLCESELVANELIRELAKINR